jgi:hypothetical protein
MTLFLAYWLLGEALLWVVLRKETFDLRGCVDQMVNDTVEKLEGRGIFHPDLDAPVRRVAVAVALTMFHAMPLFWPLGLLLGHGDE